MTAQPVVSIILPTLNRPRTLADAISGVLEQTWGDIELLVLDDASADETRGVVEQFSDPRIRYLRHPRTIGLVANWTYGVHAASGRYIAILGDDDRYGPDFVSRRMRAFERDAGIVAATGAFDFVDEQGGFVRTSRMPADRETVLQGRDLVRFTLGMSGDWFNGATLYDALAVRSLWPLVSMAGTALDFSLHIRLAMSAGARVSFTPEPDMSLRVHEGQESRRNELYLAESAARLVSQLWDFDLPGDRDLYRKRFCSDLDHYARMLWDRGEVAAARRIFLRELRIDPFRGVVWLRYLRTLVTGPSGSGRMRSRRTVR